MIAVFWYIFRYWNLQTSHLQTVNDCEFKGSLINLTASQLNVEIAETKFTNPTPNSQRDFVGLILQSGVQFRAGINLE